MPAASSSESAGQTQRRAAFDREIEAARPRLRAVIRRLVGNPSDCDDIVQDTLVKAWRAHDSFAGDSAFSTWLCAIGVRTALDHLRAQKRWRSDAQLLHAAACQRDEAMAGGIVAAAQGPSFRFDVAEHIAYCFTCMGRSLPAEQQAAVVLRDVEGLANAEAAKVAGLSVSKLRHDLAAGRAALAERFDGLCALVNKQGACWQCAGLRQIAPPEHQGEPPPDLRALSPQASYRTRVGIVARADLDGRSRALHDAMFRDTAHIEALGLNPEPVDPESCRPADAE